MTLSRPNHPPQHVFGDMSIAAGSYFLLAVSLVSLLVADLIVDWRVLMGGWRPHRSL